MQQHIRALTIGSATHLKNHGFITPEHHDRIVQAVRAAAPTKPMRRQKAARLPAFGSLAQQAQAPIPGVSGPAATPDGTSSGY